MIKVETICTLCHKAIWWDIDSSDAFCSRCRANHTPMIPDTEYRRKYRIKAFQFTKENWSVDSGLWPEWLKKAWSPLGQSTQYLSPVDADSPDGRRSIGGWTDVCRSYVRIGDWLVQYSYGGLRMETAEDFAAKFEEIK